MAIIIESDVDRQTRVTVDEYVPLDVETSPEGADTRRLYFLLRSEKGLLIEIGFSINGQFRSLTLVNLGGTSVRKTERDWPMGHRRELPKVDPTYWNGYEADFARRFFDVSAAVRVSLGKGLVRIDLDGSAPTTTIGNDFIQFEACADGSLRGVVVRLNEEQVKLFEQAIRHSALSRNSGL